MINVPLKLLLMVFTVTACIAADISIPSFLYILHDFNTSEKLVQSTITYGCLGACIGTLFFGILSDVKGRRIALVTGNLIIVIGSMGCVFAPSIYWLLVFRFIQGIGIGILTVNYAVISDLYTELEAAKLLATIDTVLSIALTFAPIIGSISAYYFGWRSNNAIALILSFTSWILMLLGLKETKHNFEPIDIKKILHQHFLLFSNLDFILSSSILSLLLSIHVTFINYTAFLYTQTFQLSVTNYSIHQSTLVLTFGIFNLIFNKIAHKIQKRLFIVFGVILYLSGITLLTTITILPIKLSPNMLTFSMVLFASGWAISNPILQTVYINIFPKIKGIASASYVLMRSLFVLILTSISSYLYDGTALTLALIVLLPALMSSIFQIILVIRKVFNKESIY